MREETALLVERPLGYVEHIFRTSGELGAFVAVRIVRIVGRLPADDLRVVLSEIQSEIPFLRAKISAASKLEVWPNAKLPFEVCERASESDWKELATKAVRQRFPQSSLLWRVWYLQSLDCDEHELVFAFHHAISDGFAVTGLVRRLLGRCAGRLASRPVEESQQPLPAPIEHCLPGTWLFRAAAFVCQQAAKMLTGHPRAIKQLVAGPHISLEDRTTIVRFVSLPAEQTRALLAAKKGAAATVQGMLSAAMLTAAANLIDMGPRLFTCFTNISLRRACKIDPDTFGCFVYWVETVQRVDDGADFWQLARECSAGIQRATRRWGTPPPTLFRHFAAAVIRGSSTNRSMGRTNAIGVSNLGPIDLPQEFGPIRVHEMYSLAGQHAIGNAAHLIAGTLGNRMLASLMFTSPIDEGFADRFTQHFENSLAMAAGLPAAD